MLRAVTVSKLVISTSVIAGEPSHSKQCALLLSADLAAGQMLTLKWVNTCSFPIVVEWSSELDVGGLVRSASRSSRSTGCSRVPRLSGDLDRRAGPRRTAEYLKAHWEEPLLGLDVLL